MSFISAISRMDLLARDAMHAVVRRLSVRPSVMSVYRIKTTQRSLKLFNHLRVTFSH